MVGIVGYGAYVPRNRIKTEEIARQWGKVPERVRVQGGHRGDVRRAGLVESGRVDYALAVGADTSQGAPNDALEFSASAGGAAYIIRAATNCWPSPRHLQLHLGHAGLLAARVRVLPAPRRAGSPASRPTSSTCSRPTRRDAGQDRLKPEDFRYVVFHMPNGKFPLQAGKTLGFTKEQIETGWVVNTMGNTYSGSSPTGLAAILDVAEPDDLILITSFGSGAGSDSFVLRRRTCCPSGARSAPHGALDARRADQTLPDLRRVRRLPREDPAQRLTRREEKEKTCAK